MTEPRPPGTMTAAEISAEYGISPVTIKFYLSRSTRRAEQGELTQYDMPLPVGELRTPREPGMGPRHTKEHLWDVAAIRRWRLAGRRPGPERERIPPGQPEGGRYAGWSREAC